MLSIVNFMFCFTGVYFCSPCNLGFNLEVHFDRHILFRHSGAGLDYEQEASASSSQNTSSNKNESSEPVNSDQTPSQTGDMNSLTVNKTPPVLQKQMTMTSNVKKKEAKSDPPVLEKETTPIDENEDTLDDIPKKIVFKRHQ